MNTSRFLSIPAEEYHAASRSGQYMSSHLLATFRESPELYRRKTSGEIAEAESPALALGRAAHCLILEGQAAFDEQFLVADGPVNPKVVHRIVTGDVPPTLMTMRLREGIPHEWGEQERVLLGE